MEDETVSGARARWAKAALIGLVAGAAVGVTLLAAPRMRRTDSALPRDGPIRSGIEPPPTPSSQPTADATPEPAAVVENADTGAADARCKAYAEAGERLYLALVARAPSCHPPDPDAAEGSRSVVVPKASPINRCVLASKGGAWVQWVTELECQVGEPPRGRWTLSYLASPDSPWAASKATDSFDASGWSDVMPEELATFDFDSDGIPEVLTITHNLGSHKAPNDPGALWTYRRGAVVRYPPAQGIAGLSAMADIDGDGRPDLLSLRPYAQDGPDCRDGSRRFFELPMPHHALADGTFVPDDAAVRVHLRHTCPRRSLDLVSPTADAAALLSDADVARRIVCARLWGAAEAEVLQALKVRYRTFGSIDPCPSYDPDGGPLQPQPDCDAWMTNLAAIEPPLRLDLQAPR